MFKLMWHVIIHFSLHYWGLYASTNVHDDIEFYASTIVNMDQQIIFVATLALGSRPRQGLARVQAKREARESHLMLPGV
jgi:hypothetical protein